jgi:hypothetical protein
MSEKPQKRLVSWTEYTLRKTLAIFLSVGLSACAIGFMLVLVCAAYFYFSEVRDAAALSPAEHTSRMNSDFDLTGIGFVIAGELCVYLLPPLLITGLALWWGSRKSWKTVRAIQPLNFADTTALPETETLVRASDLPPSDQQAELLRAAPQGSETPPEELLRATTNR